LEVVTKLILLSLLVSLFVDAKVTVDHNVPRDSSRQFKFKNVPSPARDDVAATAKLALIDGDIDPGGGELLTLVDGRLPTDEDEPGANLFFRAGGIGGRFRMDLNAVTDIAQVNSYSWHSNSRGPQLYKLYAAEGSESGLNLAPKRGTDPASCGWKLVATVSTIPQQGEDGGQYGVSVTGANGTLGRYRHLLFDCYVTELYDDWGNTFYSEIDVIAKK
jgi:hypothetical protein